MKEFKRVKPKSHNFNCEPCAIGRSPMISQKNLGSFKRVAKFVGCGILSVLVGVFALFSPNGAQALSNPTVPTEPYNIYEGYLNGATTIINGVNTSVNLNRLDTTQPYVTLLSTAQIPNSNVVTTIDHTRTDLGNLSNQYYDTGNNVYLTQSYSEGTNSLKMLVYRVNEVYIGLDEPSLLYLPNSDIITNTVCYFVNSVGADYDSGNGIFNNRNINNELVCMKVEVNYNVTQPNGTSKHFNHVYYHNTSDPSVQNGFYLPIEIYDNITKYAVQHKLCYLVNHFSIDLKLLQRNFNEGYQAYIGNLPLQFENMDNNDKHNSYQYNAYGSIYVNIPFYTENSAVTIIKKADANKLFLQPYFKDNIYIDYFWGELLNFEIFPHFRLSTFVYFAFGLILLILFVRMFR